MPVANTAAGIEAMNLILDGWLNGSASYRIRVWFDNPQGDTPTEVDFAGYTPAVLTSTHWAAADGGEISTTAPVSLGTPTTSSTDAARYWSMHRVSDNGLVYSAPLNAPVVITAGGDPFQIIPIVPFGGRN